jgi:phytoene dehydrogenase-like protein
VKVLTRRGRAVGVRLKSGEEFNARTAVLGTIHPHLLDGLVDGLDARVVHNARKTRFSAFSAMSSQFALDRLPTYHAVGDAGNAFLVGLAPATLTEYRRPYDDIRYGIIPEHLNCGALVTSRWDTGRAPPGKAVLTMWTHVPYDLAEGGAPAWDRIRDQIGGRILNTFCQYSDNIAPANVLGQHHDTPLDLERSSPSFLHGDEEGVGMYLYQFGGHRPTPELGQYAVPGVERFYLTGCHMHPGGGVIGGGRATAIKICGDLGIDFDKLVT